MEYSKNAIKIHIGYFTEESVCYTDSIRKPLDYLSAKYFIEISFENTEELYSDVVPGSMISSKFSSLKCVSEFFEDYLCENCNDLRTGMECGLDEIFNDPLYVFSDDNIKSFGIYIEDEDDFIWVGEWERTYPKTEKSVAFPVERMDIRRVLPVILYPLFRKTKVDLTIKSEKYGEITYTDISGIERVRNQLFINPKSTKIDNRELCSNARYMLPFTYLVDSPPCNERASVFLIPVEEKRDEYEIELDYVYSTYLKGSAIPIFVGNIKTKEEERKGYFYNLVPNYTEQMFIPKLCIEKEKAIVDDNLKMEISEADGTTFPEFDDYNAYNYLIINDLKRTVKNSSHNVECCKIPLKTDLLEQVDNIIIFGNRYNFSGEDKISLWIEIAQKIQNRVDEKSLEKIDDLDAFINERLLLPGYKPDDYLIQKSKKITENEYEIEYGSLKYCYKSDFVGSGETDYLSSSIYSSRFIIDNEYEFIINSNLLVKYKDGKPTNISFDVLGDEWEDTANELKEKALSLEDMFKTLDKSDKNLQNGISDFASYIKEIVTDVNSLPDQKKKLIEKFSDIESNEDFARIRSKLFPKGMVFDADIALKVYYEYKRFKKTKVIPNFAIIGAPGTGKTQLSKGLAEIFLGKKDGVINLSPASLKGAYIGHTEIRTCNYIKEAYDENKVIFIDEAYHLQEDDFGREAVDIILPIISGDREELDWNDKKDGNKEKKEHLSVKGKDKTWPPIWMGGYEHEMRVMLSENPGLYRRMVVLTVPIPTVRQLYECIKKKIKEAIPNETLKKIILRDCEKDIKDFLYWGTSKEKAEFFANYAGVNSFISQLEVRLDETDSNNTVCRKVELLIKSMKDEIRHQYKEVLVGKNEKNRRYEGVSFETVDEINDDFSEVYGKAKNSLLDVKDMLLNVSEYDGMGIRVPKGVLLVGPPGTGKTKMARAMAGEIQKELRKDVNTEYRVGFIAVAATELIDSQSIKNLFTSAEDYDYCIIFIDEIDAIGKSRKRKDSQDVLLIQLMKELDGFNQRSGLFVMAATNDIKVLDPALIRPGRFDRVVDVLLPDMTEREEMIRGFLKKINIPATSSEDRIEYLSESLKTVMRGLSPSDIRNSLNEAAIRNYRCAKLFDEYENMKNRGEDLAEIEKKIIEGCKSRRSSSKGADILDVGQYSKDKYCEGFLLDIKEYLNEKQIGSIVEIEKDKSKEKNRGTYSAAIHEVGHAVVSILNQKENQIIVPFESITIVPRINANGVISGYVRPSTESFIDTKAEYLAQIQELLGGRAAEELVYGKDNVSSGAQHDISMATELARQMVGCYGMSEVIGPMKLIQEERSSSDSKDNDKEKILCSEKMAENMDEEMRKYLIDQYNNTKDKLMPYLNILKKLADYVCENETLSGKEFMNIWNALLKENNKGS